MTTVPLHEARQKLSALVEAVERTHEVITITRCGREAAVLVAKEDLDSLHETLFWLSQQDVRADVGKARAEDQRGEIARGEELRAAFGLGR
ncbi:type II toxin-antitoxin system Phd/YefM family antitoxin [Geodermatophilus aquaeductus]|uniref:type II toxin-antitoxin system Phd/YefM family antitoxin n=1 Tax=Geodermatophilus aquaeductus TaxID=1564161 RepID=UPI001157AF88|nr:type II toxin-antitoxin system Phd/YefM family antitoxin [Geodermatophilus aquaeductus]